MQVSEIMTRDVKLANPRDTLRDIAQRMARNDIGFMPVGEGDHLVGMITDRDIVVRGVAQGMDGTARVSDVMSRDVKYCFEKEEIDDVILNMGDIQVRRLAVLNDDKRLTGVLSLADTAKEDRTTTGVGFSGVVRRGGSHTQANA